MVIAFNSRGQDSFKYTNMLEEQLSPSEMYEDVDASTALLNEAHPPIIELFHFRERMEEFNSNLHPGETKSLFAIISY